MHGIQRERKGETKGRLICSSKKVRKIGSFPGGKERGSKSLGHKEVHEREDVTKLDDGRTRRKMEATEKVSMLEKTGRTKRGISSRGVLYTGLSLYPSLMLAEFDRVQKNRSLCFLGLY